jgi:CRP/FNR family transcriptional regulator
MIKSMVDTAALIPSSGEAIGHAGMPAISELGSAPSAAELLSMVEPSSPAQMWQALHELRLRQIELEVQNEELRRAQMAAEVARAHYRELYDLAPAGYLVVDDDGRIVEVNRCAAALLGAAEQQALLNQPLTQFVLRDDQDHLYLLKKRVNGSSDPQTCELRMLRADQAVVPVELTATAQAGHGGSQLRVLLRERGAATAAFATAAPGACAMPLQPMREPSHRTCVHCGLRHSCLPAGLDPSELALLDRHIESPRALAAGQILAHSNDRMRSIYVVRSGALKSTVIHANGERQVIGLYLPGELVCPAALNQRRYRCDIEALQRSQLCAVPWERLSELTQRLPALQAQLLHLLTREMVYDHDHLIAMGKHSALPRVVQFLCGLSNRQLRQRLDPNDLLLPMTRADIGNFLNLAEETVCRVLLRLQRDGVLGIGGKRVRILDHDRLFALCEEPDQRGAPA